MYRKSGKRILDIIIAVTGLIVLLPLFVVITIILWVHFQGKPFFCQLRPGKNERIFILFKFRSFPEQMTDSNQPSHSAVGNFLRKNSLDELPQLWNVLRGDMSLVGPRPLLTEYLPLYTAKQRLRHKVAPGITGLAQIKGRNLISWEEKFSYDLWYVRNQSFGLDLKILLWTFKKVITREGIHNLNAPNVEKFKGASRI